MFFQALKCLRELAMVTTTATELYIQKYDDDALLTLAGYFLLQDNLSMENDERGVENVILHLGDKADSPSKINVEIIMKVIYLE